MMGTNPGPSCIAIGSFDAGFPGVICISRDKIAGPWQSVLRAGTNAGVHSSGVIDLEELPQTDDPAFLKDIMVRNVIGPCTESTLKEVAARFAGMISGPFRSPMRTTGLSESSRTGT